MGIRVDPDFPDLPEPPVSCPIKEIGEIDGIRLTISGWSGISAALAACINDTHFLEYIGTCTWSATKIFDPAHPLDQVVFTVQFDTNLTIVTLALLPTHFALYDFTSAAITTIGSNSLSFRGEHQINFGAAAAVVNNYDTSSDLALLDDAKILVEPAGVNLADNTDNLRLAKKKDHTCVYVKRVVI